MSQKISEQRQALEEYLRTEGYSPETIRTTGSALVRFEVLAQGNDKLPHKDVSYAQRIVRWLVDVSPRSTLARWLKHELQDKVQIPKREHEARRGKVEPLTIKTWAQLRQMALADDSLEALVIKVLMGSTLRCSVALDQPIGMLQHALVAADPVFIQHVKNKLSGFPQTDNLRQHMTPLPHSRSPYIRVYNLLNEYGEKLSVDLSLNQIMKTPPGVRKGKA